MLKIKVELRISHFECGVERVSELMQLTPTECNGSDSVTTGDPGGPALWRYVIPVDANVYASAHMEALETILQPVAAKIPSLGGQVAVLVGLLDELDDGHFQFGFEKSLLRLLVLAKAHIEVGPWIVSE